MKTDKQKVQDILKNVFGAMIVIGVLFFAFAPQSVWQSKNVAPESERKASESFALPALDGKVWKLDEHRGQVVLVNFWATWCPPCRAETPGLVRLANDYRSQGLEVVGISLDEDTGAIRPFIDEYQIPYPILLPSDQANLPLLVEALPTTLLYDRQGRIAKRYVGGVAESIFKADVERLLAER